MPHELPPLPYAMDSLQPHISAETLDYHHGKHHRGYVEKLNGLIKDTEFEHVPLEEIVARAGPGNIFNNAAQVWNHSFYWQCLSPDGGGQPTDPLEAALIEHFESVDNFRNQFTVTATSLFGSGWVWLVLNPDGTLSIESTGNADNPIATGAHPLLTCDVWEHAFYIDYRNDKDAYVSGFWELVNWPFAGANLGRSRQPEWPA